MAKQVFRHRISLVKLFSASLLAIFICSGFVFAQSGRRVQKTPAPAPTPESAPEQKKPVPKPALKPELFLKIVSDIPVSTYNQIPFPEYMNKWIVERLKDSLLVEVRSNNSGTMKESKQMAKDSADEHIVFVQLNENAFAVTKGSTRALEGEMWINFYVFAPKTGKSVHSGTSRLKPELLRNSSILGSRRFNCYRNLSDTDYLLMEASFETAERVLAHFKLPLPAAKCGNSPIFFTSFDEL